MKLFRSFWFLTFKASDVPKSGVEDRAERRVGLEEAVIALVSEGGPVLVQGPVAHRQVDLSIFVQVDQHLVHQVPR